VFYWLSSRDILCGRGMFKWVKSQRSQKLQISILPNSGQRADKHCSRLSEPKYLRPRGRGETLYCVVSVRMNQSNVLAPMGNLCLGGCIFTLTWIAVSTKNFTLVWIVASSNIKTQHVTSAFLDTPRAKSFVLYVHIEKYIQASHGT